VARYAFAVVTVAAAFAAKSVLEPLTGTGAPFVLFFGAVAATSVWAGGGPGICATLLSLPLGAYVFVVRAGYTESQAITQASLFAFDGLIIVYLSSLMVRARRAAEASEARQRDLIDLAPDAFFLADLEGRFTDVNQSACRLLGYAREELVGKTIVDIIPSEDIPRLEAVRAALLVPGRVDRAEWNLRRKDGTLVPVEVCANILRGGRWQAFVRDISERKRIEDERLVAVALLDNSSDFIGIADPSGRPTYLNPAGRRMVGLPADYPIEKTEIPQYYPAELRSFAADVIVKSMAERGRWSGETYFRHWQTEAAIPVSDEHFMIRDPSSGRILGLGTVTRDISDMRRAASEREELLAREQAARKQAETANAELRESEERFRLTIDEAPIGMALVALDGRFVRVNAALCEIVGYTADELQHLKFQDITFPDDLDSDLTLVDRMFRGEIPRYQLEQRYVRQDGEVVPVMLSGSVLRGQDGAPLYGIAQVEDIRERKRSEQALRLSEARFSGIISISADAIISIDEEQKIVLFNDGAQRIFGHRRSDVLGQPLDLLIPERFRAVHRQHVATFAAGEVAARRMGERMATIMGLRRTGEEFPAEAAISKLAVDGQTILTVALRDITDRKRVEDDQRFLAEAGAVLASSLDYEQTLRNLGELMVRDFADWCIVDIVENDDRTRRLKVVSARADQAPLAAQFEHLHLDRRLPHLAGLVLQNRRPFLIESVSPERLAALSQNEEHLAILRTIGPRSIMGLPLLIRGQLQGVLILISTSRAYRDEDLRVAEALAERAALAIENGRLYQASVHATQLREEVLGVVAHDLRNPVAAILMQARALQRAQTEREDRTQKAAQRIVRAADRMNRLIGDLLDVSLIEAGQLPVERERLSPRQFITESVEQQRPLAANASLEIRLELSDGLPDVWGDPHRLNQVLENLIGNAIKFTPVQGRIMVGASPRDGEALFWVADTGCGISEDGLSHVFDRFWQARKGARQGAGLGLPITRGIIEAHGGRIWVESTLGRGTVFFFTLPAAPTAEAPRPETLH
jgi:PAS domain S-box-containing protein